MGEAEALVDAADDVPINVPAAIAAPAVARPIKIHRTLWLCRDTAGPSSRPSNEERLRAGAIDNSPCGEIFADSPACKSRAFVCSRGITLTLPTTHRTKKPPSGSASTVDVDCSPSVTATTTKFPARRVGPVPTLAELASTLPDFSSARYWGSPAKKTAVF